jgi:hypothetical protein
VAVDDDRQSLPNPRKVVDLVRRKAAGPVGHERDHVIDGMHAGDRQRQIVGAAALPQLEQHIEIQLVIGEVEAAAQCLVILADAANRVLFVWDRVPDLVPDQHLRRLANISPPHHRGAKELRVDRADMQCHAQQRQPDREQPPSEFVETRNARDDVAGRSDQPFGDFVDRVASRPILGCASDDLLDDDMFRATSAAGGGRGTAAPVGFAIGRLSFIQPVSSARSTDASREQGLGRRTPPGSPPQKSGWRRGATGSLARVFRVPTPPTPPKTMMPIPSGTSTSTCPTHGTGDRPSHSPRNPRRHSRNHSGRRRTAQFTVCCRPTMRLAA